MTNLDVLEVTKAVESLGIGATLENNIGKRIFELRTQRNLTQEEFGKIIGLSKSGISNIENGKRELTKRNIKLIASLFQVNEEWIKTGDSTRNSTRDKFSERELAILNCLICRYENELEIQKVLIDKNIGSSDLQIKENSQIDYLLSEMKELRKKLKAVME